MEETARRHEAQIAKLDDAVSGLRETLARVATRADVDALRRDVTQVFAQNARDQANAVPAKVMAWLTAAMVLVAVITLVAEMARHAGFSA